MPLPEASKKKKKKKIKKKYYYKNNLFYYKCFLKNSLTTIQFTNKHSFGLV